MFKHSNSNSNSISNLNSNNNQSNASSTSSYHAEKEHTVAGLRQKAKKLGLKGFYHLRKSELEKLVGKAQNLVSNTNSLKYQATLIGSKY